MTRSERSRYVLGAVLAAAILSVLAIFVFPSWQPYLAGFASGFGTLMGFVALTRPYWSGTSAVLVWAFGTIVLTIIFAASGLLLAGTWAVFGLVGFVGVYSAFIVAIIPKIKDAMRGRRSALTPK